MIRRLCSSLLQHQCPSKCLIAPKLLAPKFVPLKTFSTAMNCHLPQELETAIEEKASETRQKVQALKKQYSDTVCDTVTIKSVLGGMRGTKLLLCETSQVDPVAGLSYRKYPVQELTERLPRLQPGTEPPMEALLWLLLTGKIPTKDQVEVLRQELLQRMEVPEHVFNVLDALPVRAHPMTQLVIAVSACQTGSHFTVEYKNGLHKEDFWRVTLDDGLSLLAKLPLIVGKIYRRSFRPSSSKGALPIDKNLDWAANSAHQMGFESAEMRNVLRLYVFLHADHESGNVSAHAAHLVGSALSDPFLSFASAICGLAGPLHGLANQETLRFLRVMNSYIRERSLPMNEDSVKSYVQNEVLKKGKVVPGFGHAVLRAVDPRFTLQRKFAQAKIRNDELTDLLNLCVKVIPPILTATGKVQNPYPNVDAHSGVILSSFGITEEDFYTVLFGLSRSVGVVSQLVWDRILYSPIERPRSTSLQDLFSFAQQSAKQATFREAGTTKTTVAT